MKTIPFFDLKQQNQSLKPELDAVWARIVDSREFILGKELDLFEKEFAKFSGTSFAVGVSSGLDALVLSLRALDLEKGSQVIVPANSFIATALAVSMAGLEPVFCDVDPKTLLMNAENLKKTITARTRAVIPVHLYGQVAEMGPISDLAKVHKIQIIEDACQAHGAHAEGRRAGSFGVMGCFSFYPSKNLGAFGDGGMITLSDEALYQKLRILRNYGSAVKYQHEVIGANMRLDTLQAAVLNVKLRYLTDWNGKRNKLAAIYDQNFLNKPGLSILPQRAGSYNVYHLYILQVQNRDLLKTRLEERGIQTGIHYPVPIHLQKAYSFMGYKEGSFPVTEKASKELLSLPMYPEMSAEDAVFVAQTVLDLL